MPSASPLYTFPGMTGDSDCAYRVPNSDCFHDTRFPSGYDPFQSLNAMAGQSFTGDCSRQTSPNQPYNLNSHTQPYNCATPVTSTSSHYFASPASSYCMYSTSPSDRRSCDMSVNEDSSQSSTGKKGFLSPSDDMYEDQEGFLSWTQKHPEHWSCKEVLDWLFFLGQEKGLDMRELRGEAFQNMTGSQMCHMTEDDFVRIDPKFGKVFHEMLKKLLLGGVVFTRPNDVSTPDIQDLTSYTPVSCDSSVRTFHTCNSPVYHNLVRKQDHFTCSGYPLADGYMKHERPESLPCDVIDIEPYDFDLNDPPPLPPTTDYCPPEFDVYSANFPNSTPMRNSFNYSTSQFPQQLPRRRPGRPRVKSLPDDQSRSHKDKKVKNQHLWEFIYETLMNPMYNPQYLRWENQREGVFRFVQSEAVAQLWGGLKNNDNMTYEKLSRAMRHYYKRGILERVEGRRLVYKFSRKAIDRIREKRHNSV